MAVGCPRCFGDRGEALSLADDCRPNERLWSFSVEWHVPTATDRTIDNITVLCVTACDQVKRTLHGIVDV